MELEETARSFKFKKFLYGGMFNNDGDMLLCKNGNELRIPGGQIYVADLCQFTNERWIPDVLSRRVEIDTGILASKTKGRIQIFAATYNAYFDVFKEEHSAIIIGEVDAEQVTKENVYFFDVYEVFNLIDAGQTIKRPQQILIMRMFASRDCPNSFNRKIAGEWLKAHT